jgi:hypothetical protein
MLVRILAAAVLLPLISFQTASHPENHHVYFAYPDYPRVIHLIDELNMENWKRAMDALGVAAVMAKAAEDAEIAREQEAQRLADLAAQTAREAARLQPPPATSSGNGSCYAGPIPAYIVTRESGGSPTAVNPSSGAYGCFQIMPFVWSHNCADLGPEQGSSVSAQIACANRISNGGTNLAPWAL